MIVWRSLIMQAVTLIIAQTVGSVGLITGSAERHTSKSTVLINR